MSETECAGGRAIVLDIGGTAVKSALYHSGRLHDISESPTNAGLGAEHLMDTVERIISSRLGVSGIDRIGISTAGQINPKTGTVVYANRNIPGYTGTRIKERFEQRFGLPVQVENDVNSAAIGEALCGAGRVFRDFACLTYGTGIGGALFLDGKLYHGSSCSAGEFGAIVIHPEDRNPAVDMFAGGYERYASVSALTALAQSIDPSLTDGRKIFQRKNEPEVGALIDRWIREVVYGLVSIVHMFNPSCLILGGGVMEQPGLTERIRDELMDNIMPSFRHVQVQKAQLGNKAGMFGAAMLEMLNR